MSLSSTSNKVINTPIKIQGKKRKIIPFLKENIQIPKNYIYVEPFLGSGVVAFNVLPDKAILSDINYHIINLYKNIQEDKINKEIVIDYLNDNGKNLLSNGEEFYYKIRNEFNTLITKHDNCYDNFNKNDLVKLSLLFIFLNFSSFNGIIRFNKSGEYNVPFCKKENRYSQSFITKISNQINEVSIILQNKDWDFKVSSYEDVLSKLNVNDNHIVYIDPPYIGLHNNYFGKYDWIEKEEIKLKEYISDLVFDKNTNNKFYLSNWLNKFYPKNDKYENNIVRNQFMDNIWLSDKRMDYFSTMHNYVVAAKLDGRTDVEEIIIYNK